MQPLTRQLGLALALFLIWLAAASSAQLWLKMETGRVQTAAVAAKRAQLEQALTLWSRTPDAAADEAGRRELERLIDATIEIATSPFPAAEIRAGTVRFERPVPGNAEQRMVVTFQLAGGGRLALLHQQMLAAIALLALLFVLVTIFAAVLRRSADDRRDDRRLPEAQAEMNALAHLARMSVERTEALASESGARRRAEEDLELSRTLLDQSVEDRVRLGRDLHDNLCQILYAVTLNLEGVRKRLRQKPAEAEQNLTLCMEELRAANREVRAWIAGLSPAAVRRQTFVDTLHGMLASFGQLAGIQFEPRIDAVAAGLLTPAQATEALRIAREAISNAVRHGNARKVTVHVQQDNKEVVLAVHDNGSGFNPETRTAHGHGLENMRTRADSAGGKLRITSTPGQGARVAVVLPILAT